MTNAIFLDKFNMRQHDLIVSTEIEVPSAVALSRPAAAEGVKNDTSLPDSYSSISMTLLDLLDDRCRCNPSGVALEAPGRNPISNQRLLRHCLDTVAFLNRAGVGAGDRVALVLPNGPEMAAAFLAVSMGASCAPLNPLYRANEFDFYLSDLAPRAIIARQDLESPAIGVARSRGIQIIGLRRKADDEAGMFTLDCGETLRPGSPVFAQSGDEALVLHTSGTTSRPKMVPLTHANLIASARQIAASLKLAVSDRCLNVMPLFHIHGLVGALLATLASGGSIVCAPGFEGPRFWNWCKEFDPSWYTAVPTIHQAVLARARENPDCLSHSKFRFIRSCSAALAPQLMAEMEHVLGVPVIEAYGMTEASHQIATNPLPPEVRKPGSVGLAAGTDVAVMDEGGNLLEPGQIGEIVIRGPGVTSGYAGNPDANRASSTNGWFHTGDLGQLDTAGYLFITGRIKEIINRGGQKISPREIDEVLSTHPAVAQTVTFAISDNRLGEDVGAAVVLRPGHAASEIELQSYAAERVADYKVPRRIVFVDEIPKGPTGKIQRIGLAARLGIEAGGSGPARAAPAFVGPRNPTEESLAAIWCEVLGRQQIGVHDDFLALGGDSLLAALAISRVREATGTRVSMLTFFRYPTVAEQAMVIDRDAGGRPESAGGPITRVGTGDDLPLSFAQRQIWILSQLEPVGAAYNRCQAYRIRGPLDAHALEYSLNEIVRRHAVLRTNYLSHNGEPVGVVSPSRPAALARIDLSDAPETERMERALPVIVEAANREFDLSAGPMLRPLLVELGAEDHLLVLSLHHIASDGWSTGILLNELALLYEAQTGSADRGRDRAVLQPLSIQYADFAAWQARAAQDGAWREVVEWWKKRLEGAPALLELPSDRPRPSQQTFRGAIEKFVVPGEISDRLKEIGRSERATLFMILLAAFQALLHRYTGANDIVVGVPVGGRNRLETEHLIGLFVNWVAIRANMSGDPDFCDLLRNTRECTIAALAHQDPPFSLVVESLHPVRSLSYSPIFQVTFQLRNYPLESAKLGCLDIEEIAFDPGVTQYDLSFEVTERPGGLSCALVYSTDLFNRATIARMAEHFQTLLAGIVADPHRPISRLPLLGREEQRRLTVEWNDTSREYRLDCLHRLFEEQVKRTPQAVAVEFGASRLTYAELDNCANQTASLLREIGVRRGWTVGLCVDRSPQMYVGLLAIMKAGAAYLPLDPSYPPVRLDFMLRDSGAPVLIASHRYAARFSNSECHIIELDSLSDCLSSQRHDDVRSEAGIDDPAYLIYTSGSTGAPNGVVGLHRGAVNRLQWAWEEYPFSVGERACQKTALSFVDSVAEIFGPLLKGVPTVIIGDDDLRDPRRMVAALGESRITRIVLVPSLLVAILELDVDLAAALPALRLWTLSGEALSADLARRFYSRLPDATLLNLYGSTEVSADATAAEIRMHAIGATVPIGRPIANTTVFILDRQMQPVPIGVPGQICIGGTGLARGYHNAPDLTARRFIAHPLTPQPGARLFATGDMGRYLPDGTIEYLGRTDSIVKIRGIRIDLAEVEANLGAHPAVAVAAALAVNLPGGDTILAAWVRTRAGERLSTPQLREFLASRVPDHLIPSRITFLDTMPSTPSGKVDRAALLKLGIRSQRPPSGFLEAPRDNIEARLKQIWEELLGTALIGIRQEFFEVGGHSLLAVKLLARIEREFNHRLPLSAIFQGSTIERLAAKIRGDRLDGGLHRTVPIAPHGSLPPLFVVGTHHAFRGLAEELGEDQPVIGLTLPDELSMRLPYNIEELATYQVDSILEVYSTGPCFVAGFSAEGVLAYEVARQLKSRAREVALLVMIDTTCPTRPLQSWTLRMASNAREHLHVIREYGFGQAPDVLLGILRRAALRARLRGWGFGSRWGILRQPPAPKRPEDFVTSLVLAKRNYVPQPYGGRALLVRQATDQTGRYRLRDYGWGRVIRNNLEILEFPGDHLSFFSEPFIGDLAQNLAAAMRNALEGVQRYAGATVRSSDGEAG